MLSAAVSILGDHSDTNVTAAQAPFTLVNIILFGFAVGISFGLIYWAQRWSHQRKHGNVVAFPRTALALISIFVGFVVSITCAMFSQHDLVIDSIAGLTTAILTIQIGEIMSHSRLSGKLGSLERALESSTTYERVNTILNNLTNIRQIRTRCPEADPFIREWLNDYFARLNINLALLAGGEIRIDDTSRELTTNTDFLLKLPTGHVWAVSYQDEKFWDDPEGADFLDAHRKVIALGREVHRIFLLKKDAALQQRKVIENQVALGVKCYVVVVETVGAEYHEDFVLYDHKYVRFARLERESVTSQYKIATLTSESSKVTHYVTKWEYLRSKSQKSNEFYDKAVSESVGKPAAGTTDGAAG